MIAARVGSPPPGSELITEVLPSGGLPLRAVFQVLWVAWGPSRASWGIVGTRFSAPSPNNAVFGAL